MKNKDLFRKTRSKTFLMKSSALLALVMLALGTGISFLNTARLDLFQEVLATPVPSDFYGEGLDGLVNNKTESDKISKALVESLESEAEFYVKLMDISDLLFYVEPDAPIKLPTLGNLETNQQAIAQGLVEACADGNFQSLEKMAEGEAPPDANYALALAYENANDRQGEVRALNREIDLHNPEHAREKIVDIYLELKKYDILDALAREPEYKEFFTPWVLQDIAINRLDWPMILKTLLPAAYENLIPGMVLLAILSGLVWATILIRFNGQFSNVWKFVVPTLLLGALSAHLTLLAVFWQHNQMGFDFGEGLYQQLLYCLTIGLREEFLKLLCFVPLIPFLRRKDDLLILTVAGLVGLGFALEENINYFNASIGLSAVARFATANFLHIALTAMCGLTLARAVFHRGEEIQHAVTTFIIAVAIHGFYDAFLMVDALMEYSWLTYTVFVLMAYQYFGWLRHLRTQWQDHFSITATFTYGVIIVMGLTFTLFAWYAGAPVAAQTVISEAIGIAIILILFYREIPETIDG